MTQERRIMNEVKKLQIKLLNLEINPNISEADELEEEIMNITQEKYELQEQINSLIQESLLYSVDTEEFQTI